MTEVAGDAAERDDEVIVGDAAVGQNDGARFEVDRFDLAEVHADVFLVAQNGAERLGDFNRGQAGGGHLVK